MGTLELECESQAFVGCCDSATLTFPPLAVDCCLFACDLLDLWGRLEAEHREVFISDEVLGGE